MNICTFSFNFVRFKADSNGLLLASDVAARGLDIPQVEHIIHYQVPKSTEVYSLQVIFHCTYTCMCAVCMLHLNVHVYVHIRFKTGPFSKVEVYSYISNNEILYLF